MRRAVIYFFYLVIFIVLLLLPSAVRYLRFYGLDGAQQQEPPVYEPASVPARVPTPAASAFVDQPDVGRGLVLLDTAHDNRFELGEISYLDSRLAARGYELLPYEEGDLASALRPVSAFMVIAPMTTFDEEVESAGTIGAVEQLVKLRDERWLDYVGAINSDYTAPREPGDDNRYIYRGTIGKLLPCFYIRGCETHLGEAFRGLDANLIAANLVQEVNLNVAYCDEADGEITVPSVTQKVRDFKARYDAQTPIACVVHCSFLIHGLTPEDVLVKMVALAGRALGKANQRRVVQWGEYAQRQNRPIGIESLGGRVWTYQQLYEAVEEKLGKTTPDLRQQIEDRAFGYVLRARELLARLSPSEQDFLIDHGQLVGIDSRERSTIIVRALVEIADREGVMDLRKPSIVVYFAPPFFPPIRGNPASTAR